MAAKMSQNPMYPDANPTAPGGMSRKGLIDELVNKHGYEAGPEWDEVSWPDLIDLVVNERLAAEQPKAEPEPEPEERPAPKDGEHGRPTPEEFEPKPKAKKSKKDKKDKKRKGKKSKKPEPIPADVAEREDEEVDEFESLMAELGEPDEEEGEDHPGIVHENRVLGASTEAEAAKYGPEPEDYLGDGSHDDTVPLDEDGLLDPETLFAEMATARDEYEDTLPPPIFIGVPGVRDYIFDGHAGAGPSAAERWMNCTMSLSASRRFLETLSPGQQREYATSGTAAEQGTTAHSVGEAEANYLLGRIGSDELNTVLVDLAMADDDVAYDDEMAEYVSEYTALVQTYATERGADNIFIEQRVEALIPLTGINHDDEIYVVRGSLDFGANPTPEHNTLVVGDLKYGKGIEVDVDGNPQIRLYALGKLAEMVDDEGNLPDLDGIDYYIAQPRLGGIKRWSESVDDLIAWRDEVLAPALTKALYGEAEGATYEPSELACQWCPARGGCPALADLRIEQAQDLFTEITDAEFANGSGTMPSPEGMDNDRLGDLLLQINGLDDLRKSLKEEAQRRLHRGEEVKNFTLVSYTPRRSWVEHEDPVAFVRAFKGVDSETKKALFAPRTLVTPAAAEKILGDKFEAVTKERIVVPEKRPVISTGPKDRRKKWEGKAPEEMFDIIEEDES